MDAKPPNRVQFTENIYHARFMLAPSDDEADDNKDDRARRRNVAAG